MTEQEAKHKWDQVLQFCKQHVTDGQFQTWFVPMKLVFYIENEKKLCVSIPSQFFFEYIEGHFKPYISAGIVENFGQGTRLFYKVLADKENKITTTVGGGGVAPNNPQPAQQGQARRNELDSQLNREYVFENFISGVSNKFPRSVGESIAANPDKPTFNPLFIYGPCGCGKTHLVNAIGMKIKELHPEKRVLYLSAHLFEVQYTDSVRNNRLNDFMHFYQSIQVLIIDDIQEIAGLRGTQNVFFHIFNHLRMNGCQIILTADRSPVDMQGMEDRLLSRFKWGLTAELEKPNKELRRDILVDKIERDGLMIPNDVVNYIADNVDQSVRDLEGVVNSLMAHSVVHNRNIDLTLAQRVLNHSIRLNKKPVTLDEIVDKVCAFFEVERDDIYTKSRKANVVNVRQVSMYLASKFTTLTVNRIGQLIGKRNHATVLHSIKAVNDKMSVDKDFRSKIEELEKMLREHRSPEK